MKKIGLTGGIGSGKSTVARLLDDAGIPVVDADQLAREVVEPGQPALAELAEEFGDDLLNEDGSLNRGLLAERAFVDKQHTEKLNAITHPAIRKLTAQRFAEYEAAGAQAVIYDMPLLIDLGMHESMDLTVVVSTTEENRIQRLGAARGIKEADARNRIAAQVDEDTRRAAADVIIDNNGAEANLEPQVSDLADRIRSLG